MKLEAYELQNNGVTVSKKLLESVQSKYKAMYSDACRKLYDLCYQGSPSEFSLIEIVKAMREEFPQYINLFVSEIDASLSWTAKRSSYVLSIAKARGYSKEFIQLVSLLVDVFKSKEAVEALDNLFNRCRLKAKLRVNEVIYPKISISTKVRDASKFKCDNAAVRETFVISDSSKILEINTKHIMRDQALRMLGVSEDEITEFNLSDEAAFSSCLSKDEELKYLDMFLSGTVKSDGRYADLLSSKIDEEANYSIANKGGITVVQKFVERVFVESLNERCAEVASKRKELSDAYSDVRVFYVTDSSVLFEVSNSGFEMASNEDVDTFEVPDTLCGSYVLDYCSGEFLPIYCTFEGVSGEYILQGDITANKFYTEVKPSKVRLLSKSGEKIREQVFSYYNISDVYYSDEKNSKGELITKTLVPKVGNIINTSPILSEDELLSRNGVTSRLLLYYVIRQKLTVCSEMKGKESGYLDLVAELYCAYIYISNGICSYTLVNSDYSYVDKNMYDRACFESYELFKKDNIA